VNIRFRGAVPGFIVLALVAVLGQALAAHAQAPGYTDVSAGRGFTAAIVSSGNAIKWGLGTWNDSPGAVPFTQISAGGWHICALTAGGSVDCWGENGSGQSTDFGGLFTQVSAGWRHSCGLRPNGEIFCWGANGYGQAEPQAGPFSQVSAGQYHSCALLNAGGPVHCWGRDGEGQGSDRVGSFMQVSAGWNHNCAIRTDGTLDCWGGNDYGQAQPPTGTFLRVASGDLHTCGIKTDGTLKCWGYNFYGQVGKAPAGTFKTVTSGLGHSCAISTDDLLYCWGRNDWGQANVPGLGGPAEPPSYTFQGLFPPVEADPVLNVVKAGGSVPLKFSLGDDHGLDVLEAGYPASGPLDCKALDPGETLTLAKPAGGTGLSYDPASGRYSYVWKTEKTWVGTCRYLSLRLVDGTEHRAAFQFK
jgi:alpha-tubulin suppressor-like RCC1 family protein